MGPERETHSRTSNAVGCEGSSQAGSEFSRPAPPLKPTFLTQKTPQLRERCSETGRLISTCGRETRFVLLKASEMKDLQTPDTNGESSVGWLLPAACQYAPGKCLRARKLEGIVLLEVTISGSTITMPGNKLHIN